MKILFIGGLFTEKQKKLVEKSSFGVVQNAANVLQSNILKGLIKIHTNVELINLPFIGSYPKRFDKFYFPPTSETIFKDLPVTGLGFINVSFLKYFSRFIALFKKLALDKELNNSFIMIYSFHLPFIMAAVLAKKIIHSKSKICLIVPDLPEYMSDQGNFFYKQLKKAESYFCKFFLPHVDCYILLTNEMSKKLKLSPELYIVIEGVANLQDYEKPASINKEKYIFYSGTLAERYGIKELVDAFVELKPKHYQLWICGDGDSLNYIEKKSITESGIKYLGQLPREKVIELQKNATVLVNPRRPEGEFTKYSFPSKIMEYMTSGRPVVMHKLPGIPSEYFQYCYTPTSSSFSSFVECLNNTLELPSSELTSKGLAAKNFIKNNKTDIKQAEKIKDFLLRNN